MYHGRPCIGLSLVLDVLPMPYSGMRDMPLTSRMNGRTNPTTPINSTPMSSQRTVSLPGTQCTFTNSEAIKGIKGIKTEHSNNRPVKNVEIGGEKVVVCHRCYTRVKYSGHHDLYRDELARMRGAASAE